jgi:hypothetical protein
MRPNEYVSTSCRTGDHHECTGVVLCACTCHRPDVDDRPRNDLRVGSRVYARNRSLGTLSGGFTVVEVLAEGYLLRRWSDGSVLPEVFGFDDVRPERRSDPVRRSGSEKDRRPSV